MAEGYERIDALKLDVEGAEDIHPRAPSCAMLHRWLHPQMIIIEGWYQKTLVQDRFLAASAPGRRGYAKIATQRGSIWFTSATHERCPGRRLGTGAWPIVGAGPGRD